ncbi:hypothetical protein ABT294_29705 [Nonomuraea sp. NPDC000554]|uniref:glycine-rich domain-containing protein n=1 Tax=Nonomuraea sp. NPDC000554 TaxID=3154259 RepID=UPI003320E968
MADHGRGQASGLPSKPYTTPGRHTFTVPSGVSEIKVVLTGAGGGGDTSNPTAPGGPAFGGGAGGYAQTWCAGSDAGLHFGQKGANGNSAGTRAGGIPGMPGSGVHSACPQGTGVGGYGGNGPDPKPGLPGQSGCVILTY